MAFQLQPLPTASIVDERGYPTAVFAQYWQQLTEALTGALLTLANVEGVVLPSFESAIMAAQDAATAANTAAEAANTAAASAAATAAANAKEAALVNSYIVPSSVLTATASTITIAPHTRMYADGTSVAVDGSTIPATGPGDTDYIFYSDPSRAGGAVAYEVDTAAPTQGMDVHVVGAITIPATGSATGGSGPRKPGFVEP